MASMLPSGRASWDALHIHKDRAGVVSLIYQKHAQTLAITAKYITGVFLDMGSEREIPYLAFHCVYLSCIAFLRAFR